MLKNRKIGKKLILSFLCVAVISSIAGIVGLSVMTNMNTNYKKALVDYGFSQGDIGLFNSEFNRNGVIVRNIVIDPDVQKMMTDSDLLSQSNEKLNQYLATLNGRMTTEQELQDFKTIQENIDEYKTLADQVVTLAIENKDAQARTMLSDQVEPIADKIEASANALISGKIKTGNQVSSSLSAQGTGATVFIFAVILLTMIVSCIVALRISRGISKPVTEMAEAARRMAEGDLNVQIQVDSHDEIGQLGAAFSETVEYIKECIADISVKLAQMAKGDLCIVNEMEYKGDFVELQESIGGIAASLNDVLLQISQASEQVTGGAEQISNGAQALAQGATEQASSVEELSASIMEVSAHIRDNAEHAANAILTVRDVSREIEISNGHMQEMMNAMARIDDSSGRIGKIIKTIEDIAFQTNILALNAAVEAARAGAAGKGFAVVAGEVRSLASKSAQAAQNTTSLIEESIKQVKNGSKIADETAKSLQRVVEGAETVSSAVEKISQASRRQSDAIAQITTGVDQISNVVQTNSATAEESAASSEELSGQAQTLNALVKRFRLKEANEAERTAGFADERPLRQESVPEEALSEDGCSEPEELQA